MKFRLCFMLLASLLTPHVILAQTASLRGRVTDERGGVVPAARVILNGPAGLVRNATTDGAGQYEFVDLPPGDYTVQASAPKLALLKPAKISLKTGEQTLDLQLRVNLAAESVTVQENSLKVSIDATNSASARVLSGDDLKALADNPDDLLADLQALAGASAGPGGSTILIDGFSGGQLPSRDSIREIRINSSPFSPEYDRLGLGRIEIFTRPGTDRFRGSVFYNFADDFWNSRNPYAQEKAPFLLKEYGGNLAGPINKRSSFIVDVRRDSIDNGAIINAITLDPDTLAVINPFTGVPRIPQRRVNVNPRVDYQLNSKNTLTVRCTFSRTDISDAGLGSFNLVSRGYHSESRNQTLQLTETALLTATIVNETRFQFIHGTGESLANSFSPSLNVLGSFNGGGVQVGHSFDKRNSFEFQNYTSMLRSKHFWKFGLRLRREAVDSTSPQNFGGTFTFGGGTAPVLNANNQPVLDSNGQAVLAPITSIERYRRTLLLQRLGYSSSQIRALGGGATQFSINAGNPALSGSQADLGAFVSDEWRVRPNLTLNLGLRYETQSNIHDWCDFAPRIGLAWAPRATTKNPRPKTVVRAGFGVFYDRFSLGNTLSALRYNGIVQQQYLITNPDFFPAIPPISSLAGYQTIQSIRRVSPTLRAPYLMQSAISMERELVANVTVAVTYANTHGLHQLRSRNTNAPLAGTYDPNVPGSGVFPLGSPGPVFLMESAGLYNQNQLIVNVNSRFNRNISLSGSYTFNHAMSNTDGLGTYPAKPYDFTGEYGPAATDTHHHVSLSGSINTIWSVRFSPLLTVDSGPPFDITVGRDLYGTMLFNGRPGIAADPKKPGLIMTSYGLLDPNPTPDEKILPRNYGRGPGSILLNLTVARIFAFGERRGGNAAPASTPAGAGGGGAGPGRGSGGIFGSSGGQGAAAAPANRRFSLSISLSIRNLLNHNNPGSIIGNITSPLFGQANQPAGSGGIGGFSEAANNRRLELMTRLNF